MALKYKPMQYKKRSAYDRAGFGAGSGFKSAMDKRQTTFDSDRRSRRAETALESMRTYRPFGGSKKSKGKPSKKKMASAGGGGVKNNFYGKSDKNDPRGRMITNSMTAPKRHVPGKTKKKGGKDPWSLKNPALAAGVGAIAGAGLTALFSKRRNKTTTYNITSSRYPYVPRY